jgi:hypothetical protein
MFYKIQKNEHEGANFFSTKMTEIENLGIFGLTLYMMIVVLFIQRRDTFASGGDTVPPYAVTLSHLMW